MKSAYGFSIPGEDVDLTHVEAGSPMGELLRRYWQPVCLSSELSDLPRRVRILCEDLVVFRDGKGKVGCLHLHCAHRGSSLEYGRIEAAGIRCCYHGWLYDAEGRCIDMPCEAPGYAERMDVWQPAYPTHEYGGLVFLYMGPPEKKPLFPMYDILDTRGRDDVVLRGMRLWADHSVGWVRDCNWLQHFENNADPFHILILHNMISGDQFGSAVTKGAWPRLGFERTPLGTRYTWNRLLPNGNRMFRHCEKILPNIFLVPNIHERGEIATAPYKASEVSWCVPADNEHLFGISIVAWPLKDGVPDPDFKSGIDTLTPVRPGQMRERTYEERQLRPDDMEAQESQRPIAIHALETLALSDREIVQLRRLLREAARDVAEGRDPPNIIRDAATNRAIPTHCETVIVGREEAHLYAEAAHVRPPVP
jgi:phenylpropionate dioxygenase-like ring-hydroxylating dioxygenase large terminal subunit